jgi:hypothetical protein
MGASGKSSSIRSQRATEDVARWWPAIVVSATSSRGLLDLPQRPSQSSQGYDLLFHFALQDIRQVARGYLPSRCCQVLEVSSESMAAFQAFSDGRFLGVH